MIIGKELIKRGWIVGIVPARSGSKGVVDKNIKVLGGHPLLSWSIKAAQCSTLIQEVLVTSDSPTYLSQADNDAADFLLLRPVEIAQDHSTDTEYIEHALNFFAQRGAVPEYLVQLRPTSPVRNPSVIDRALELFLKHVKNGGATSLRSVHEMPESAYKSFERSADGRLKPVGVSMTGKSQDFEISNQPRQTFPLTYSGNGYVDIVLVEQFLDTGLIYGDNVLGFETEPVLEVDSAFELNLLIALVNQHPELEQRLFSDKPEEHFFE